MSQAVHVEGVASRQRRRIFPLRRALRVAIPLLLLVSAALVPAWVLHSEHLSSSAALVLVLVLVAASALFLFLEISTQSRTYEEALQQTRAQSAEMQAREAHFRVLAEAIPQLVWAASADGTPDYFNQRWVDYTGNSLSSRGSWLDHVHSDDADAARSAWETSLNSGKPFSCELQLRSASGEYRWHLARALSLRDDSGAIVRWLGTFTDIDDQRRTDEAMSQLAAIIENSEDAIFSKDLEGFIKNWNRGAEKMYGYSPREAIGKNVSILVPPERRQELETIMSTVRGGHSVEHLETIRVRKDGKPLEVSLAISPIRDAHGALVGASTIARDVTQRNRAAEALRKTEKLAETGRLAGAIAHEINNPLEAVTHLLYLLERHPSLNSEARGFARVAMDEVDRIGHIAKQALGFYREASSPTQVTLSELIANVAELYRSGAQNKGVRLETELQTTATVPAFPGEMRQVFSNLIVNAVDAVPRGGMVKVRVKHARDWKSHRLGIRVLVADNGPGIPTAIRPHIFEPFFTTKGERGTGVGLWVTEGVLQKHNGSIRLKSSTNTAHGTTFSVFLPYG